METILNNFTFRLLLLLVITAAAIVGTQAKVLYKKHVNSEEKEAAAHSAAMFVEQVYKDLHGAEKLEKALDAASELLKKRGIRFDREEMKILIEAAVGSFNDAFNRDFLMEKDTMLDDVLEDYDELNTYEE